MKRIVPTLLISGVLLVSCGGSRQAAPAGSGEESLQTTLEERNSAVIPLITRIRQLPGITLQGGVPMLIKANNTFGATENSEPLYVLDGIPLGNSFSQVRDIVQITDVESISLVQGADASFYGSRGSNGVIIITTKSGG